MTDNEIIKALECCNKGDCDNCPNNFGNCYANLAGYALDLISRQKAEVERLKAYDEMADGYADAVEQNAIKEFAERLKEELVDWVGADGCIPFYRIKRVIEEMTEKGGQTMTKEKQIEEMAVELAKIICNPKGCFGCNLCDEYGSLELNCEDYLYYRKMAESLYNAGYRKQSEGKWEIMKMGDGERVRTCSNCLISQSVNVYKDKVMFRYCPYCGAKMKGESDSKA